MAHVRRVAAALVCAALLAGCGGSSPRIAADDGPTPVPIATNGYRPGMGWETAYLQGTLTVTRWESAPCFVITLKDDTTVTISWPQGFSARFSHPAELFGPSGEVVAREGQLLGLGGGFGPAHDSVCGPRDAGAFGAGPVHVVERAPSPQPSG